LASRGRSATSFAEGKDRTRMVSIIFDDLDLFFSPVIFSCPLALVAIGGVVLPITGACNSVITIDCHRTAAHIAGPCVCLVAPTISLITESEPLKW
jgi:hypothetical protein